MLETGNFLESALQWCRPNVLSREYEVVQLISEDPFDLVLKFAAL